MKPFRPPYIADWLNQLQATGRYTFMRQQAIDACGVSPNAAKKALQRLAARKRVVKIKDYFYGIVPVEYLNVGAPPTEWFIADLMAAMKAPYYAGLLTAAALHGSSHHAPQEFQVVTDRGLRPLRIAKARIHFFSKEKLPQTKTLEVNTPAGRLRISTPEATALDLVRFSKSAGGLDHVAAVIGGLTDRLDPQKLLMAAQDMGDVRDVQRLGFLLDALKAPKLAKPLASWLASRNPAPIPLYAGVREKGAVLNARWSILAGQPLEIEA